MSDDATILAMWQAECGLDHPLGSSPDDEHAADYYPPVGVRYTAGEGERCVPPMMGSDT